MKSGLMKSSGLIFVVAVAALFLLLTSNGAHSEAVADDASKAAGNEGHFAVQFGVFTHHFFPSPVHVNRNRLINIEWQTPEHTQWKADRAILGLGVFRNSFGQPSQYLYVGQKWDVYEHFYIKLTAGLLHGYKDQYKNKIPFNQYGTAPVIVPSMGLRFRQATLEAVFLSNRAVMIGLGYEF